MSSILSNSIVVIVIAVSASYAVWRLGPRRMRDALRMRMHKALPRVFARGSASTGGCDACEGCASTANTVQANVQTPTKEHPVVWRRKSTR